MMIIVVVVIVSSTSPQSRHTHKTAIKFFSQGNELGGVGDEGKISRFHFQTFHDTKHQGGKNKTV